MDCVDEIKPGSALGFEDLLSIVCQPVVAPPSLARFFHPSSGNPSTFFQAIQQWVKRGDVELQNPIGAVFDELADLIAVPRAVLNQGKDQKFRAALFQLSINWRYYMFHSNIWYCHMHKCQAGGHQAPERGAGTQAIRPTYSGANVGHPDRVVTGSQLFGEPHTLSSLARVNGCYVAGRSWFGEDMPNRLVD